MLDPHDYIPWPSDRDEDDREPPLLDEEPELEDPGRESVDEVDRSMRTTAPSRDARFAQRRRKQTGKL